MKRFNETLYQVNYKPYCSLICSQRMAKRLVKELNRYRNLVIDLVEKYPDEFYSEEWSLAYPNGKQTAFYTINKEETIDKKIQHGKSLKIQLEKIENIYEINEKENTYGEEVKRFVTKDLEDEIKDI